MKIKDFSDAMIKVASINDDRIKAWDDFRKGMELYDKIRRILSIWDELTKGYYTPEDSALGRSCLDGISVCDQELNSICGKAITDKVQSEILSILFHR